MGYQLDPFLNRSDPLLDFKLMSNLGLANLKMKSDFVLSKVPPIKDAPIVHFMDALEEMDNRYNKVLPTLADNYHNNMFYIGCKISHISP